MNVDAQALGRAVLNYDARAGRPSMAMKLRRELSPPLIASRVSCASERKLFFFGARWGVGLGKGARA